MKIRDFTDLVAWQEAHGLALMIYKVSKPFPKEEMWGLTNQIRRASVSVTSNIAEGFARQSKKEKVQFYYMSLGSNSELLSQLMLARDLKYLNKNKYEKVSEKSKHVNRLLRGLVKYLRS